jgi:hypothetical protein
MSTLLELFEAIELDLKNAEERGYLRAKREFEKIALSCCCSGCTEHNMFLIGENDGKMHSVHGQPSEEVKSPHGDCSPKHISD